MSTPELLNNRHIIDDALNTLATDLSAFVANNIGVALHPDVATLIREMLSQWDPAFHSLLGYRGKNLVFEVRDIRNDWAHNNKPFGDDDTDRALDSIARLLIAIGAASGADRVNRTKEEHRRARYQRTVLGTPTALSGRVEAGRPQQQPRKWESFAQYLRNVRQVSERTIGYRISNCKRVEQFEGDLDEHFERDQCHNLLARLAYSARDQELDLIPKHNIPINGDVRNGSATLKHAVSLYAEYRSSIVG